jgi:PAS domain S-box-containing protein
VSRAVLVVLAGIGALLYAGAVTVILVGDHTESGPLLLVAIFAGVSFVVTGIIATARRPENRTGPLMLAVGYLWALGSLSQANASLWFTLGFVLGQLAFGPFAHLLLSFPTGILERRSDRLLVVATWLLVTICPLAIALVTPDPVSGCDDCPDNAFLVWDNESLGDAIALVFAGLAIAIATTAAVKLVLRYRAASPPQRRVLAPVAGTSVVALLLLVLANVVDSASEDGSLVFSVLAILAIGLIPVAFLLGLLRTRLARGAVANVVVDIGRGTPLRQAIADALDDPSLEIAYWSERQRSWVDEDGRPRADPDSEGHRQASFVEHDGHRIAALVHDATLADQPGLIEAVSAAASLQLRSERLRADLRSQLNLLDTAVNTSPSLLTVVDTEGRIRNFNRAVELATGLDDAEQIRGEHFWNVFIDPADRDEMRARFAAAAPDFEPTVYENVFTNAKGEPLVIQWSSAPIVEEGRVVAVVAGGLDVTERKRREEELQRERDSTDTLVQTIPTLIAVTDERGIILSHEGRAGVNRAFRDTLGWTDDDVGGRHFVELVAPEDVASVRHAIESAGAGARSNEIESRWWHADGRMVLIAWSATRIPDPSDADRTLVLISGTDVTERKRREQELQWERDFANTLAEIVPSLLVVVEGDATITPDGVNRAFEHTLGLPEPQTAGMSFLELLDPEDEYMARMAIGSAANGVPAAERESRWMRPGGEPVYVAWTATPIPGLRGKPLVLISGVDVTERRRQEEEIRASRARIVQATDDARRRLERNLHDGAQQRLVSLSLSLRLAEAKLDGDPEEARAILLGAREELSHALDELRELARGIHPAVLTERGLTAALEGVVARTPLPVELELPAERLPGPVEAAAYYVVSEALTNVAKYAGASSAHVRVRHDEELELVTVDVMDDGAGGADPRQGSGLRGLADRVAALDGTLEVDSPPGEGTRVRATIPIREAVLSR